MKAPEGVVAVVLGGGSPTDVLAATVGAPSKALVPLAGGPLGAYVLEALRGSGIVSRIVFVGPIDARLAPLIDVPIPSGARLVDSLALGLGAGLAVPGGAPLLVVSADIPWWSADGVRAFVEDAPEADLVYPVVLEEDARSAFPEQRRTFVRLRDGGVTGGNATIIRPAAVPELLPWIDRAFAARKRPWQLAGLIGVEMLLALLTGRATLAGIEARVRALVGIDARVMVSRDAAIAADVDAPEHLPSTLSLPALSVDGGAA